MDPSDGSQRVDHGAPSVGTAVTAAYFHTMIEDSDEDGEIVPASARPATRSRRAAR
jgi:hypothetical protein